MTDDDPFDDPRWRAADLAVGAPPRPGRGFITCSLSWLAKVRPLVHTSGQMLVLLLLYRECLICRSRTVALSNADLTAMGIGRRTKYRLLTGLQEAGALTVKQKNGRSPRVTLHWFP
jgi:hypothetical protein